MATPRKVSWNENDARRVAAATLAYERGGRDMPGVMFRSAAGGDEGGELRICKTTAVWMKNTTTTLQVWEAGTPGTEAVSTGETLSGVVNKVGYVPAGMFVLVARAANGGWYLVESEMPSVMFGTFTAPWIKGTVATLTLSAGATSFTASVTNTFANITGSGSRACAVGCDGVNFRLIAAEC